jgi:hypothetical protein
MWRFEVYESQLRLDKGFSRRDKERKRIDVCILSTMVMSMQAFVLSVSNNSLRLLDGCYCCADVGRSS